MTIVRMQEWTMYKMLMKTTTILINQKQNQMMTTVKVVKVLLTYLNTFM